MKKKVIISILGLLLFVFGFGFGYEYKAYELRKIFTDAEKELQEVFDNKKTIDGESVKQTVTDKSKSEYQMMLEEKEIIIFDMNDVLELATIEVIVKSVEEKDIFNRKYSEPLVARENAKFIVVGMDVTNTTSESFNFSGGEIHLVDSKERSYTPSSDLYSSDGDLVYRDLMPNLKESGILLYEVPDDSENYSIFLGKSGTDTVYKILLK